MGRKRTLQRVCNWPKADLPCSRITFGKIMKNIPKDFWEQSEYSRREYEAEPVTSDLVSAVEKKLGYKLPRSMSS